MGAAKEGSRSSGASCSHYIGTILLSLNMHTYIDFRFFVNLWSN